MAKLIKPPQKVFWDSTPSVFLAGTIDNGQGEEWQQHVEQCLVNFDILILNPRRDQWDASLEQRMMNPTFRAQVEWELEGLENASMIFMYFAPNSQSPITLLELGLYANSQKIIVVCPDGYWRKGNIEVITKKYNIPLFDDLSEGISALIETI